MSAVGAPSQDEARNSKMAIASLVIGIISLFGVMPIFGGAIAIVLGYIAKSEIDSSLGELKGTRLATTGQVLGAVHIVGAIVITCCVLAYVLFGQYLFPSGRSLF
jgi:ABC-type amino acid transport system permease subunit